MALALAAAASADSSPQAPRWDDPGTLVPPPWKHTLGLDRVGQSHLDLYSGYRKKFSNPQGLAAIKLHFNDEEGTGDDDELTVYGLNAGTGEIFYNTSMFSLGFFGEDMGERGMSGAVGLAADAEGNVFVADRAHDRVLRLRNEQNVLRLVGEFDLDETGLPLRAPTGVAVEDGWVYITDSGNDRIVVTDLQGSLFRRIGATGQLIEPFDVAVISSVEWNFYGAQLIAVTDSLNQRLRTFALDGTPLDTRRFDEIAAAGGGFYFVAIDYHANVYVTDPRGGCIYKFDRYLNFLTRFGCGTNTKADLNEPRGIAVYRRFGQVFVAERAGASYFWVGTDVQGVSCTAAAERGGMMLRLRFLLTERSRVSVVLRSRRGREVKTLEKETLVNAGRVERVYTVAGDDLPCPIAECDYTVAVSARPTYSSRKYHSVERTARVRRR